MVFQVSGNDDDVAVSLVWNAKEHLFVPIVMRLSSTRPLPQYPPVVSRSPHVRILTKLTQKYPRLPSRFSPSANQQGKETAAAYRLLVLLAKVDR